MEKRSSIKDSGLSYLFKPTEAPAESEQVVDEAGQEQPCTESGTEQESLPLGTAADDIWPGSVQTDASRRSLIQPSRSFPAVIRVVGVGGAGTNAINRMLEAGLDGVEFIAINTDAQALATCEADHKLRIGRELTKGLGGGSDTKIGREAAVAAYDEIKTMIKGSDMVFITAGGTGTGAAPVVAEIAKSIGALTIGVVSRPFTFEGKRRGQQAMDGVRLLRERADTVIVVPNDKLLEVSDRGTTMIEALRLADDVLRQGVQGICDLVTVPGLINLDLADVRTIMTGAGTAHMGIGRGRGEGRAQKAAEMAVNSSLLETSIEGARGILLNISGGKDMSLFEVNEVAEIINAACDPEANIIFGAVVDERLADSLLVTVVATGFDVSAEETMVHDFDKPSRTDRVEPQDAEQKPAPRQSDRTETARQPARQDEEEPGKGRDDDLEIPSFLR
jgi:cell division protein FtsZ